MVSAVGKSKRKYTVILLYPEYSTDNFGQETYAGHAFTSTPEQAIKAIRRECRVGMSTTIERLEDLYCIFVCEGHHVDPSPGQGGHA